MEWQGAENWVVGQFEFWISFIACIIPKGGALPPTEGSLCIDFAGARSFPAVELRSTGQPRAAIPTSKSPPCRKERDQGGAPTDLLNHRILTRRLFSSSPIPGLWRTAWRGSWSRRC